MYNTSDPYMVKNTPEQERQSMVAEGVTMNRYPSSVHQFISSLFFRWICTGHDYWMYRGDEAYMKTLPPVYCQVLSWCEQWLKPDYSLSYVPHWLFVDWTVDFDYGKSIREKGGDLALQDLMYIIILEFVAEMEQTIGPPVMADRYRKIAIEMRKTIRPKYWDAARNLFANMQDHRSYSQHVDTLAILTGVTKGEEAVKMMNQTLVDTSLIQCTVYFRYYLNQALRASGLGDQFLDNLQIWRDQMALGLTTQAEISESSRSDCHAWGASLNIEFYRILLGIDSDAPGFGKMRIAPSLGKLKEVSGTIPRPLGSVTAAYKLNERGEGAARLALSEGTTGIFIWDRKEIPLKLGEQVISLFSRH